MLANPSRIDPAELATVVGDAEIVVVRYLGGPRDREGGFAAARALSRPLVVLGGERVPDVALMALSAVPAGIATATHGYLAEGSPGNLAQLHASSCPTRSC